MVTAQAGPSSNAMPARLRKSLVKTPLLAPGKIEISHSPVQYLDRNMFDEAPADCALFVEVTGAPEEGMAPPTPSSIDMANP